MFYKWDKFYLIQEIFKIKFGKFGDNVVFECFYLQ